MWYFLFCTKQLLHQFRIWYAKREALDGVHVPFSLFLTLFLYRSLGFCRENELLVLYHIRIYTVYTGGGDPQAETSPAYFCIAGQINPLRSQTASLAIYLQKCCQFHILHSSKKFIFWLFYLH